MVASAYLKNPERSFPFSFGGMIDEANTANLPVTKQYEQYIHCLDTKVL